MIRTVAGEMSETWDVREGYRKRAILPLGAIEDHPIQLQMTEIEPGDTVNPHRHLVQTEVIYFLSGSGKFSVERERFDVNPGDVVVIQPREIHDAKAIGSETLRFLTFKLDYVNGDDDTEW